MHQKSERKKDRKLTGNQAAAATHPRPSPGERLPRKSALMSFSEEKIVEKKNRKTTRFWLLLLLWSAMPIFREFDQLRASVSLALELPIDIEEGKGGGRRQSKQVSIYPSKLSTAYRIVVEVVKRLHTSCAEGQTHSNEPSRSCCHFTISFHLISSPPLALFV